mmetsp:Transcript_7356/g.17916  ORF Transcript_7356/g.17916 Transcript_7356/m.17916 type:complete len:224 (-) Transcript_7356:158-829(-)
MGGKSKKRMEAEPSREGPSKGVVTAALLESKGSNGGVMSATGESVDVTVALARPQQLPPAQSTGQLPTAAAAAPPAGTGALAAARASVLDPQAAAADPSCARAESAAASLGALIGAFEDESQVLTILKLRTLLADCAAAGVPRAAAANARVTDSTPLIHLAATSEKAHMQSEAEAVRLLCESGADPNAIDIDFADTALHRAAYNAATEVAHALLAGRADPNAN